MLHQILGLRERFINGELKMTDCFYEKGWRFEDLREVFKNPQAYISDIPPEERFNMYFTVAHSLGKREFGSQKYIPFDIDHIDIGRVEETLEVAIRTLGREPSQTLSLFSGNGIQFHIELEEPFTDTSYFDLKKLSYKGCCERIDRALKEAGLPGKADSTMWSLARIMRLPDTLNKKKDKPERMARVINSTSVAVAFDIDEACGLPKIKKEEQLVKYPQPDTQAVLEGCENIKLMLKEPKEISEPLWYALASIIGLLGGNKVEGRRIWHEYSSKDPRYSRGEAERKLEQALAASGPRTCESFASLPGSRCAECKFKGAKTSPITITGPKYIKTRETGFHSIGTTADGEPAAPRPNYGDLRKYFEEVSPYVVNAESGGCYVFRTSHYDIFPELMVKGFAQDNFLTCDARKANEFAALVKRTNLKYSEWFSSTTEYKMNLANGVLDVKSGKFTPGHSMDLGFMFTLDFDYDPHAKAPVFEQFLEEISCGDKEIKQLLLEFGGYALSNDKYWCHKALILLGEGSNGKNTFVNVLKNLAGNGYCAVEMKNLANEQHRARLEGKLFNFSEEASVKAFYDTDTFKALSSGGEVTVKTVYEKPYEIINRAKIIIACNRIPDSPDDSHGFFRRFAIVPFNRKFEEHEMDHAIDEKLHAERAGILNMFLAAYAEMKKRGRLSKSTAGEDALEQYKVENNPLLQWYEESVGVGEDKTVQACDLYSSYAKYCEEGRHKLVTQHAFSKRLKKIVPIGVDLDREYGKDGKQKRIWKGIFLADNSPF